MNRTRRLTGIAASPGIGYGVAFVLGHPDPATTMGEVRRELVPAGEAREAERHRLDVALASTIHDLEELTSRMRAQVGADEAAIFEVHALFLQDPSLLGPMYEAITEQGRTAEIGVTSVLEAAASELEALPDPYLCARSADLRDVERRVLHVLAGAAGARRPHFPTAPHVLVAKDLAPSSIAALQREHVQGIVLAEGTATAHTAILVRGLGIPLVVGVAAALGAIETGTDLLVDGSAGLVLVEPTDAERLAHLERGRAGAAGQTRSEDLPPPPYHTSDGHRVELAANASSVAEARLAVANGAEGVGVLRTEFLLATLGTGDGEAPGEDALSEAYAAVLREVGTRPVVVRAMDAGGDKPLPFLHFGHEANPFLGWRGIRILLDEPALFAAQARALLRASSLCGTELRLMFPMITTLDEFIRARRAVEAVCADLHPILAAPLKIGAMIEVPAAALIAGALAREADFLSIGTNDLVQYTLACDRGNSRVADLCRFQHPAVLRLVHMVVEAAHAAQCPVGACGESAGNLQEMPLLVGLGVDELSVGPARLLPVRDRLRTLDYNRLRDLAAKACSLATAGEVAQLLAGQGLGTGI